MIDAVQIEMISARKQPAEQVIGCLKMSGLGPNWTKDGQKLLRTCT